MAQLYHQASQQGIWTVLGPPTACAVQLAQPLVITYADGTTQTLPAHTPATTGSSATQVDRTSAVWVVYALKGETIPTLHLAKEQDLAALTTDYAPIARLLADRVVPYQPQQPGSWSSTTIVALTSSPAARALSLWAGSANGTPPTNWQTPGFDDSAWLPAAVASYVGGSGFAATAGVIPIWATTTPASTTERCLVRQRFALPAGVPTSATLTIEADDIVLAVYINGTAIAVSGAADLWPQTLGLSPSLLLPGSNNVIAIEAANSDPAALGHAAVDYQLSVTYAGTTGGSTPSGSAASDPTTQPGDLAYRSNTGAGALAIGFIGDSITAGTVGGGTTPTPSIAGSDLAGATGRTVTVSNQGINGTTSADWLPGGANYSAALAAFAAAGTSIVHVVLGTNDAKTASVVPVDTYRAHMSALAQALAAAGYTVVLSYQPYITPGALGEWDATSDTQLLAYQGVLAGIANGSTIRLGDTQAYGFFLAHQSELADGVHPTAAGKTDLGALWANGLLAVVTTLQRLTLGTGLSITSGVLSAAGSVSSVSGTAPITVASGTTTPVVSIAPFGASGSGHAAGAVPDPGNSAGHTRFLCEDATWVAPAGAGELLAQDGTSAPPTALYSEDGTDWLSSG